MYRGLTSQKSEAIKFIGVFPYDGGKNCFDLLCIFASVKEVFHILNYPLIAVGW